MESLRSQTHLNHAITLSQFLNSKTFSIRDHRHYYLTYLYIFSFYLAIINFNTNTKQLA